MNELYATPRFYGNFRDTVVFCMENNRHHCFYFQQQGENQDQAMVLNSLLITLNPNRVEDAIFTLAALGGDITNCDVDVAKIVSEGVIRQLNGELAFDIEREMREAIQVVENLGAVHNEAYYVEDDFGDSAELNNLRSLWGD
jgi:hypothetical protein